MSGGIFVVVTIVDVEVAVLEIVTVFVRVGIFRHLHALDIAVVA